MKKQITLISAILLASGAFAQINSSMNMQESKLKLSKITPFTGKAETQGAEKAEGDLLWSSDFSVPADWTIATTGQGTFVIGNNSNPGVTSLNQYVGAMASTSAANGFAFFNGVQYLLSGTLAEQNTTITSPAMDMDTVDVVHIEFEQRYRAFNQDVTYVEFSTDGGATWTQSKQVNYYSIVNDAASQNTLAVDFTTNNAANCKLRFRWESLAGTGGANSGYGWAIDDVKVKQGYEHNLTKDWVFGFVSPQEISYTKLASNQLNGAQKMSTGTQVYNVGNSSENAFLRMTQGAFTVDGTPVTLASFADDSLSILEANGYTIPTAVGNYPVTVSVMSNNTLSYTVDDAATIPMEVTSSVSAVDAYNGATNSLDGSFDGWSGGTSGDKQGVGTYFEAFSNGVIGSVQVGIGNIPAADQEAYVGLPMYIEIRDAETGDVLLDPVSQSDTYLNAGDFGKLKTFYFDPIDVTAGQVLSVYFVAYTGADNTIVPVAYSGFVPAKYMIGFLEDQNFYLGSDWEDVIFAPVVRVDFKDYSSVAEANIEGDVTVAPNPFSDEATINFTLKSDATVSAVVTDLAGRTVMTVPASVMNAGKQSVSVNGADFKAGVYNYTLTVNGSSVTKRIVKK